MPITQKEKKYLKNKHKGGKNKRCERFNMGN